MGGQSLGRSERLVNGLIVGVEEDGFTVETREIDVTGGDELRRIIGGWLEAVCSGNVNGHSWVAYGDEEAKLKPTPRANELAMHLMAQAGSSPPDLICGTVVFLGADLSTGDETSVPDLVVSIADLIIKEIRRANS